MYIYIHSYWCFVQMLCMVEILLWDVVGNITHEYMRSRLFLCAFRQSSLAMIYLVYVCT